MRISADRVGLTRADADRHSGGRDPRGFDSDPHRSDPLGSLRTPEYTDITRIRNRLPTGLPVCTPFRPIWRDPVWFLIYRRLWVGSSMHFWIGLDIRYYATYIHNLIVWQKFSRFVSPLAELRIAMTVQVGEKFVRECYCDASYATHF